MALFYADNFCTYTEDMTHYIYKGPCKFCKKPIQVAIPKAELYAYNQGGYIQESMKSVSVNDREFLMSGTCGPCWDEIWKEPDDEEMDSIQGADQDWE